MNEDAGDFLYHYTTVDSLEAILRNRTIRSGRLDKTDDPDEEMTDRSGTIGRFCYASCWTDIAKESIPMWNMHSGMSGVRIGLKRNPFKKYSVPADGFYDKKRDATYFDLQKRIESDSWLLNLASPGLLQIGYTDDESKLHPPVFDSNSITDDPLDLSTPYIRDIGRFKRPDWGFQSEWRYEAFMAPFTYSEFSQAKDSNESIKKLASRLNDENYEPSEDALFFRVGRFGG